VPALLHPHRITIETLADGEWSEYTSRSAVSGSRQPLPPNDPAILGFGDLWAQENMSDDQVPFLSYCESPQMDLILSPRNGFSYFSNLVPSIEVRIPLSFDPHLSQPSAPFHFALTGPSANVSPFTPQYGAWESPFSQLQVAVPVRPMQGIHFLHQFPENIGAGHEWDSALTSASQNTPKILVQSLLQDAAEILRDSSSMSMEVVNLPDPDDVLDSLLSLLPESQAQDDSEQTVELTTGDVIFDSTFHRALLFSIINGFAGLRNVPSGSILRMLRKQHQMSSRLFDCLRSCPPNLAKPLADNLFRAAVEACDEQAVIIILQSTRNSPNAIVPNDIACESGSNGRLYTPIELAAKFRHLGIVRTLLAANADVNKTYEQEKHLERGALELAIGKWGSHEAVDMELVRTFLDCHAEVRVDLIEVVIRRGQANLIQELISRLLPASHRSCFKSRTILKDIAHYLRNDLATRLIKQILNYCQAENCMRCPKDYSELMDTILSNAAMRGNHELVKFLLGYTTNRHAALSAAVRNGSRELIDLFLKHGASVGGPTHYLDEYEYGGNKYSPNPIPQTTPLAEAIRSQDNDLVQEFENLGALSYINQENHFKAAIFAAAEVGDCSYMQKLLERVPEKRGGYLTLALNAAIHNNKTEAALILLDAGADVNTPDPPRRISYPAGTLNEALRKKNKAVVEEILESDVHVSGYQDFEEHTPVMELAGRWGDIPIIEDLILMGADIDAGEYITALGAAVKSKNRVLVDLLIKYGASPSKCAKFGYSPLKAAVINADDDMMRLLISNGADPANHEAFLSAIRANEDSEDSEGSQGSEDNEDNEESEGSEESQDNEDNRGTFKVLLEIFTARYPQGKKGFGADLLIAAIEEGDTTLCSNMLMAKMDVNSFAARDYKLVTALGFAISYRNGREPGLVQQLLNAGGDPNGIVSKPVSGDDEVKPLETALIVAIKTKNEQMVQLLLNYGAEVHRPARRGLKRTPLQQACEIGSFKIVKLLLDKKANVNDPPAQRGGGTALQLAAISGSIKIARFLLAHGAFVHAPPAKAKGRSAFEGAAEYGRLEMLRELWVAVAGQGFSREQIERAISLAESKGHRGCAEYIASLSSSTDFSTLQVDSFITYDVGWGTSVTPSSL
jgi:ankyrin repeat protein